MRLTIYTKTVKWYNLIYLAIITSSAIAFLVNAILRIAEIEISVVAVAIAGILALLGIFLQKPWAKWLAIAIYSLYIFSAIEGLINSFSMASSLQLVISYNALVFLRIWRLSIVVASLIGIALLLKNARTKAREEIEQ